MPALCLLPYITRRSCTIHSNICCINDIFYLVTTFVVQLTGAKAANKAISGARHLPDQGVPVSWEGQLAGQRSRGLGRDV
jgi:hypothetical protein